MVAVASRRLKVVTIIDKTVGVVERNSGPALIYLLAMTIITGGIAFYSVGMTAPLQLLTSELLKAVVGIVAGYFLLEAMIRNTGLQSRTRDDMFLPYLGLSLLYGLGVLLGFMLLFLPGLLVMARWCIAQPLLVAQGGGRHEGARRKLGED